MTQTSSKAKKLARMLLKENRKGRSYRKIAKEDGKNKVDQSTLSRISRTKGKWLPKDKKLLGALGVLPEPKPKRLFDMTPEELLWRLKNRS